MMVKGAVNHPLLHPLPLFFFLLWSTLTTTTTKAARDNDYYYPSFINPNTEYKMYWKDSVNVLEDLDQFESLYIRYHGCVWSKYGTMYGTGEDYDEQGNDNDNDGSFDNGCNGFGGGEYYWYMGRTQCFKANVAYSLYGVLKGDDPKKKRGSYCHGGSYINSFFTTYGVESFAGPMGLGTYTANSVCLSNQNGGGGNAADFSYAKVDDDYLGDDYTFYDAQSYISQGTGCSANGHFVIDQYNGPFCHGTDYDSTLDQLEDFNSQLQDMDCVEIYSDSANNNNDDDDQRRAARDLGEDEQNYDFDYEYENYAAYHILTWSKSCSVAQYPNDCPDPYGLKHKYSQNIQRALAYKTGRLRDLGTNIAKGLSWVFFAAGVLLCAGIYYLVQQDDKLTRKQDRQRRRDARKAAKVKEYKKNKDDDDDESTVIERGIESTLSNLSSAGKSVDSKASKKSNRSCLPKLKMPKKLKRGGGGAAGAGEGSTRSTTTMTALEVDYQGGVMEMEQVFEDDEEELSHTDTSLAESQIYMSEKEEQVLSKEAPPSPVRSYLANKYNVEPAATSAQPEKENDDQSIKSGKSSASTIDRMFGRQSSYATPYTAEVQVEQEVGSVRQEEEPETTGYIPMGDEGSKSKGDPPARQLEEQPQQQSDPEGYVTMEQLLDQAASFVSHTTTGVSTMNSWTTEDHYYNAEGSPKKEGELIISRAPTAEWGMAPVKGDDDSTLSGCSSRKGTAALATAGAVAGTAALAAAAAAAASPKTKSKKFPPLKLRAITSPLRKSSKKNKDKEMNTEEASPKPVEGSTKLHGVPPLPVPVTPLADDLKEDDASSLGVSQDQDILVDASSFDRIMASMAGQDPPADDDSECTGDGSKPEPSDAVEQSLFDYGDVFSDEEAAAVSTIAEEDSKMVAEEEEEEEEDEVLEDGQELQLADPSSPTPKKKKKVGGFFRRNPKSPENTKSLRGLFTKSGKALSPSQMVTAPPPMLVTPPSSKSTTQAGHKVKSPASPLKKKFFSSLRASRKQPQQSADAAPTLEEPNKERDPEEAEEEGGKEEEEESVAELTAANAASFDLTNMIDIIEPVLPPESQKDLFSATPPMSQKSISPASQKGLSPLAAKDQQQQSGSPGGVKQVLL